MSETNIIGFLCNWCSYAGADLAGVSRLQYPPNIRSIRVMCSGRVDPMIILDAFILGADGVLISGCHPGDCHYQAGNFEAQNKINLTKKLLKNAGFQEERLRLEWVSAAEGKRFAEVVKDFTDRINALGTSPLRGETPDLNILANLKAAKDAIADFRLRALVSKERKIVDESNVYGERKSREEFTALLDNAISDEYIRKKILNLTKEKSFSTKELAQILGLNPNVVLEHIVALRKKNQIGLLGIEGTTPRYISLVSEVQP